MSYARRFLRWYDRHRRDLPWRPPVNAGPTVTVDPYFVLISEAMLQQTQVATVIPYYKRFIAAFPTIRDLAAADEQAVLRLWQGLGYYSRARNLLAAARMIVSEFDGQIPSDVETLLTLPGVGRYTAGAIASIAFNRRAPILDGNVARVLCRLDLIKTDPRDRETVEKLWARAEELVPRDRPGAFNQAMMELGATVCTPRNPQCLICPLNNDCKAFAAGQQDRIPVPRKAKLTPRSKRWTFCIHRKADNRWLIEQRPATGRWPGMWQFVTVEADKSTGPPDARMLKNTFAIRASAPSKIGRLKHALTHRRYEFDVYHCRTSDGARVSQDQPRKWVTLEELSAYPLPRPHVKISQILAAQ